MRAAEGTDNTDRLRVLVVGAAGQLGQAMVARLRQAHEVVAWTRADADLRRHADTARLVRDLAPQVIVNCASYNEVDAAEDEQELAFDVNAFAVRTLAAAAADLDAVLLHYSTDFVFDGTATEPYTENDQPEPRSVYAQSKLVGEWMAADAPRHYVVRVESLFGGPRAQSSVDRIIASVRAGTPAPVFVDRVVSPSYVSDVADASAFVIAARPPHGVYHCVNSGHATWFEVGAEIARRLGRDPSVLRPVSVADVTLRAARPQFAALSNARLAAAGYTMPSWPDAITRYLASLHL